MYSRIFVLRIFFPVTYLSLLLLQEDILLHLYVNFVRNNKSLYLKNDYEQSLVCFNFKIFLASTKKVFRFFFTSFKQKRVHKLIKIKKNASI